MFMPQFDLLTLSSQGVGLLVFFYFLYLINIQAVLPCFIEIQKFRVKKLAKNHRIITYVKGYLNSNLHFTYSFYSSFFDKK